MISRGGWTHAALATRGGGESESPSETWPRFGLEPQSGMEREKFQIFFALPLSLIFAC